MKIFNKKQIVSIKTFHPTPCKDYELRDAVKFFGITVQKPGIYHHSIHGWNLTKLPRWAMVHGKTIFNKYTIAITFSGGYLHEEYFEELNQFLNRCKAWYPKDMIAGQ